MTSAPWVTWSSLVIVSAAAILGGGCGCGDDDDDDDAAVPDAEVLADAGLDAAVDAAPPDASVDAAPDAEVSACCPEGGTCCPAAEHGYPLDLCAPPGEPCPEACSLCRDDEWCEAPRGEDPVACVDDCGVDAQCPLTGVCCPLGSACVEDDCPLPDLTIDEAYVLESARITTDSFDEDACEVVEGCIPPPGGDRTLLRFGLRTPNVGVGNLHFGFPSESSLFEWSDCHRHYHFSGYARYRLLDAAGNEVAPGHKQAFCLMDYETIVEDDESEAIYDCRYQGIQAGWADVYVSGLPCQWIDVTGVPPGDYTIEATVNFEQVIAEATYDNNQVLVPFTIVENSCVNGCIGNDDECCQPDDPCGWTANGSCDCYDRFGWDAADCASCTLGERGCPLVGSCPGGCTPFDETCCVDGDPCGWSTDGECDCQGLQSWDAPDCDACVSDDPDCPVAEEVVEP